VLALGAIAYGALLGASAAVGDDGLRDEPDRVAHPIGDDQCAAAPGAEDDGLVSSFPKEVDRPNTAPSAGKISYSAVGTNPSASTGLIRTTGSPDPIISYSPSERVTRIELAVSAWEGPGRLHRDQDLR
jgi:hypothetical protein